MAPFVEKEWGSEAYTLMKRIKQIFDPKGIINPGVIINDDKNVHLKNNYQLNVGLGINVLRKNLINFKEVMDLGNNPYLATIESDIEFTKFTKKDNYNALTINYQIQSRYNMRSEADYYRLIGKWKEINGGWQHGVSTLYNYLSYWSFIYTYGRPNYKISLYFSLHGKSKTILKSFFCFLKLPITHFKTHAAHVFYYDVRVNPPIR